MLDFGISRDDFFQRHFEKMFFFKKQALTGSVVNWEAIDEIIHAWDPADATMKVHQDGVVATEAYLEQYQDIDVVRQRIVADRLRALLGAGATLLLGRVERKNSRIDELCSRVAAFTGEKTVANGYAAFGGGGTFGKHWDTHDVFAIQLIGRKQWTVYEPTYLLPLVHQRSTHQKHLCPPEPVFDGVLEAGDMLYLPRGWWHQATPLPGQETFHIAAGVHTSKAIDYIEWCCKHVLPLAQEARVSLLPGADNAAAIRQVLEKMADRFCDERLLAAFVEQIQGMGNVPVASYLEGLATPRQARLGEISHRN